MKKLILLQKFIRRSLFRKSIIRRIKDKSRNKAAIKIYKSYKRYIVAKSKKVRTEAAIKI